MAAFAALPLAVAFAADQPATSTPKPKRDPAQILKGLDHDKDGVLTFEEWKSGMVGNIDPSRMPEIFKKKDADGDGKLTLSEFMFIPPREPSKVPTVPPTEKGAKKPKDATEKKPE